jgi:DNA primase small subunit
MAPGILLSEDVVMEDVSSPNPYSQSNPPANSISAPLEDAASDNSDKENQSSKKIEDIFNDDDSDDDLLSSMPVFEPHTAKATDPDVMRAFYQRLLPFRFLFMWLNHSPSPTKDFQNREFAFTLPNDAYLRYQSFATADLYVQ